MFDGKAFGEQMVEVVRQYVDEATAPLLREIESLKAQSAKAGQDGRDGADGKDCDMEAVMARVDEVLRDLPQPDNGKDGRDGADADMDALRSHCETLVAELPKPEKGLDGKDGRDGKDGVGLAGAVIDRNGELVVTLTNGEAKSLGPVLAKDGRDGERGADGFSLKDFDTEFRHDDKVLVLKFDGGDVLETHEIFLPYVRDCGVWKEGVEYLQGDGVTWAGSFWTAQKTTAGKPDAGEDWRLAVKRGRDGKSFEPVKA